MGFSFMYWDYFKQGGKLNASTQNADDLGGYTEKELYVEKVFVDYKEEILSHIDIETYQTLIQEKTRVLMTSAKVKKMKAYWHDYEPEWSNIIKRKDPPSINHISSLVLYTDLSEYCSRFSATFRKSTQYESLQSVKKRNGKYWWQSKYILETVRFYGIKDGAFPANPEKGPFYSGVDVPLCLEGFSLRLRTPTSTSKQIAVALNFSKRNGIIISLNNTGYDGADQLPSIDCSWFSGFVDEVCYNAHTVLLCLYCLNNDYLG